MQVFGFWGSFSYKKFSYKKSVYPLIKQYFNDFDTCCSIKEAFSLKFLFVEVGLNCFLLKNISQVCNHIIIAFELPFTCIVDLFLVLSLLYSI